jgi:hypothetical protein
MPPDGCGTTAAATTSSAGNRGGDASDGTTANTTANTSPPSDSGIDYVTDQGRGPPSSLSTVTAPLDSVGSNGGVVNNGVAGGNAISSTTVTSVDTHHAHDVAGVCDEGCRPAASPSASITMFPATGTTAPVTATSFNSQQSVNTADDVSGAAASSVTSTQVTTTCTAAATTPTPNPAQAVAAASPAGTGTGNTRVVGAEEKKADEKPILISLNHSPGFGKRIGQKRHRRAKKEAGRRRDGRQQRPVNQKVSLFYKP